MLRPIELIALVRPAASQPSPGGEDRFLEVEVLEAIYGHAQGKIRIADFSTRRSEPFIVVLAADIDGPLGSYDLRDYFEADEAAAIKALAQARLDRNVLGATTIFLGREVEKPKRAENEPPDELSEPRRRLVRVERTLHGDGPAAGQEIAIQIPVSGYDGPSSRLRTEPLLYFVERIESRATGARSVYHADSWLSPACEAEVRRALARRDAHPIVDFEQYGEKRRVREIVFPGTTAEAIRLIDSTSEGAVQLGASKLLHEADRSLAAVAAEVESRLFAGPIRPHHGFLPLRDLIRVLCRMENARPYELDEPSRYSQLPGIHPPADLNPTAECRQTKRLLDLMLDRLASDPPPLDWKVRPAHLFSGGYERQEDDVSTNHALTWLAESLPRQVLFDRYYARLSQLRSAVPEAWRPEIDFALRANRFDDTSDRIAAQVRMAGVRPLTVAPTTFPERQYSIAFSRDGKRAVIASHVEFVILNTRDWSIARRLPSSASQGALEFSQDGKSLFVGCWGGPGQVLRRIRCSDGAVERKFPGHEGYVDRLALSADETVMVSRGADRLLHVWDVASGRILRSYEESFFDLRPDGKLLIRRDHATENIVAESLPDGRRVADEIPFAPLAFAPDGSILYALADGAIEMRRSAPPFERLEVRPIAGSTKLHDGEAYQLHQHSVISADGTRIASLYRIVLSEKYFIRIVSLPKLELVSEWSFERGSSFNDARSLAISPDGRVVALESNSDKPKLFETATGKPILIEPAHPSPPAFATFESDGRTLRTYARDEFICRWNAATGSFLGRRSTSAETRFVAARSDGRVAVYASRTTALGPFQLVDGETGKVLCQAEQPAPQDAKDPGFYWIGDREVLICQGGAYRRLDYRSGSVLASGKFDQASELDAGKGRVAEDGRTLFAPMLRSGVVTGVRQIDLETMAMSSRELPLDMAYQWSFEVVPDGKHLLIDADLVDRRTLGRVAGVPLASNRLLHTAVSPDARYFACLTLWEPRNRYETYRDRTYELGVYRIPSCEPVALFRPSESGVKQLAFSADGSQLAIVSEKAVEIWPLAGKAGPKP